MINTRTIVNDAYKMIGAIGDQEALDGTRTNIGLQLLNDLIYQYNLDNFFAFTATTVQYSPTVSKPEYTIGIDPEGALPDADIVAVRPANILRAYYSYTSNMIHTQINQVAPQDIYRFQVSQIATGFPQYFAYVSDYPYGKLQFSTSLTTGVSLKVVYSRAIEKLEINDVVPVPPEYESALKYSLAFLLSNRYGLPPETIQSMKLLRDDAVNNIQRNTLSKTPLIHELYQGNGPSQNYNIYSVGSW